MTVSLTSDLCAQGKHEWCMNRSPAESHCQCPCHKSSNLDYSRLDEWRKDCATDPDGVGEEFYALLEMAFHLRAERDRWEKIADARLLDIERLLRKHSAVETSSQLSEDARDAARYRVVRVSSITGAVLAHELDAACDVIIATRNAVKAGEQRDG